MESSVETFFTPFKARIILLPWRWVCDISIHPTLFAIIPEDWYSHWDSQTYQHQNLGQMGAFFGIYTKTKCWLGGEPKWLTTTAPGLKWRTVSPLITSPECDKNQLLKSIHDTFFAPSSLAGPSSRPAHPTSSVPLERGQKWLKFTSCIFIIALWCKMCRKCLPLLSLKTLESVQMHCELGKLSCHFTVDIELSICLFFPPLPHWPPL